MDSILPLLVDPEAWVALAALVAMEVVLGIDNLVFVSILTNKLPEAQRAPARRIGLGMALVLRLLLLSVVAWIIRLTDPVFEAFGHAFSWKDMILLAGGLFLVWKATREIHHNVDPETAREKADTAKPAPAGLAPAGLASAVAQILVLDLVFSIDSIVTAVGMTAHLPIMMTAVVVAVLTMMAAAGPLSRFLKSNPTFVMLALGFLLMIGMTLLAEGFGVHVPKGYIYAAMSFSVLIEILNMLARRARRRAAAAGEG